jgi:UDP-2,3-diacylglucosamine hydrolase
VTQAPHIGGGERLGLIAGNGRFPIIFADNARKLGYQVSAVAHEGETDPDLVNHVDRIHWIKIGQLNKLIKAFKEDDVHQAVMLGGIKKTHVFTTVRPDFRTLALATRLALWKDDDILREFAKELEREGITICESTFGLEGILAEEGTLTPRQRPAGKSGRISDTVGRWRTTSGDSISASVSSSRIAWLWRWKPSKARTRRSSEAAYWPRKVPWW